MINKVILVGNLGRDPEVRTSQGGTPVGTLNVATSENVKDRDGNWTEHTEWHRVVCFGRTAENAGRFLEKGRRVYVEGRLRTNKWKDKDGVDRYTTEILADVVKFLDGGKKTDRRDDDARDDGRASGAAGRAVGGGDHFDDSIPF